MKRLFVLLTALSSALSLNAQEIKYRHLLEPEGLSVMTTKLSVFPWGEKKLEYALQYEIAPVEGMHQGYYLNLYFDTGKQSQYVPERGKLLIRTTQGHVISLSDCGAESFKEYYPDTYIYRNMERSTSFFDNTFKEIRYNVHAKYPISEDDLKMLMEEGVIKIRIETTKDVVECSYKVDPKKPNKTAEVITKLYNVLVTNIDPYYGL